MCRGCRVCACDAHPGAHPGRFPPALIDPVLGSEYDQLMPRPLVTREDLMLVLADGAETGPYPFDPVRLMKACFVVSMSGRQEWQELFHFRPYDYGPFDPGVYSARDALLAQGLLTATTSVRYDAYALTDAGRDVVADLIPEDDVTWLRRVGGWVSSKSFSRLLDEIYARWPEYATQSIRW